MPHADSPALLPPCAVMPPSARAARALGMAITQRRAVGHAALAAGASLYWVLAFNQGLLGAMARGRPWSEPAAWPLPLAMAALLFGAHLALLALLGTRRTLKPLIVALTLVGATGLHFSAAFGVVVDPPMLRNALRTDWAEARELLSWALARDLLLYAALPIALGVSLRVRRVERGRWPLWATRAALLGLGLALIAGALAWQVGALVPLMRQQRELRYLATPLNAVWSVASVLAADARGAARPRQPIGLDARLGPASAGKPRLVVMVVGETARAANWGLNGYARQTTPALSRLPVIAFGDVAACGSSTEVSLPCMFAPVGRRDYDEARIRGSESLLHVAARAGVAVHWRDNQSGCKGVCAGLSQETVSAAQAPALCRDGRCLDEALLLGLDARLDALARAATQAAAPPQLLVLHMLGNHGPAYHRRYPAAFERFTPACHSDDLSRCDAAEIVNAYDNALLYTDHVLAALIATLRARAEQVDSAMVYVSDHGESLGEKGLMLHGMPYALAPREQLRVPMVLWWSDGLGRRLALDGECMRERARQPAAHDHLFHTLLALLDVHTALAEPALDLTRGCRPSGPA
jgi:lipid A ethanolaminephosphotransferase